MEVKYVIRIDNNFVKKIEADKIYLTDDVNKAKKWNSFIYIDKNVLPLIKQKYSLIKVVYYGWHII